MRAVFLDVPEHLLAERRRLGLDVRDEMWEGVLHMVPPPRDSHQRLATRLVVALGAVADAAALELRMETGLFNPAVPTYDDYKVPDLAVAPPDACSERGIEGRAALVVEIASPGDETLDKLGWYGSVGVAEVVVIDRDTRLVRRWRAANGHLREVAADGEGWHDLDALPVALRQAGDRVQVRTPSGTTEM